MKVFVRWASNNSMQRRALRAAADAGRWADARRHPIGMPVKPLDEFVARRCE